MKVGIEPAELQYRLMPGFAQNMRLEGKAESTIRIYTWAVDRLLAYAADNEIHIIDKDALRSWAVDLKRLKPHSSALAGVGVRRLLHWAADAENNHQYRDLADAVPTEQYDRERIRKTLTPGTVRRLESYLLHFNGRRPTLHELRDRALFFYIKGTAARVSEILQVRRDRFERDIVKYGGRKHRALIPPPGVIKLVEEYLAARSDDLDCLWIAIKTNGVIKPLADDGVLKIWERLARKVGVQTFTTQQLRQTAGAILVERGHDLTDVMEVLDLKDIRSVQGYQQLVNDRLMRVRADLDVGS